MVQVEQSVRCFRCVCPVTNFERNDVWSRYIGQHGLSRLCLDRRHSHRFSRPVGRKWNGGCFVKSGPFSHKMKLMLDLHFTYLGGGRTHPTHQLIADGKATDHYQKGAPQDGRLPELIVARSCYNQSQRSSFAVIGYAEAGRGRKSPMTSLTCRLL